MFLYRAKEIGNRERLRETCLKIIERGDYDQIVEILPHIRIIRSDIFYGPLIGLLSHGTFDQKAAAALALGSLGDSRCIPNLRNAFIEASENETFGSFNLQAAVIESLGDLATEESARTLTELAEQINQYMDSRIFEFIISSLGQLAQQGVSEAEEQLINLMVSSSNQFISSLSMTELLVSYWHRPDQVPEALLEQVVSLTRNGSKEMKRAAMASLMSLAQLGCTAAGDHLSKMKNESEQKKAPSD